MSDEKFIPVRRAQFRISPDFLGTIITKGWSVPFDESVTCEEGVPPDAKFIDAYWDVVRNCFFLIYEHESFDEVNMGDLIPTKHALYRHGVQVPAIQPSTCL